MLDSISRQRSSASPDVGGASGMGVSDSPDLAVIMRRLQNIERTQLLGLRLHQAQLEALDDLRDAAKLTLLEVQKNRVRILAGHKQMATLRDPHTPWLFVVLPDTRKKPWMKGPRAWLRDPMRVHLLCNGRHGQPAHFLFNNKTELEGEFCGYELLKPGESYKRWAPVIKIGLSMVCLAAKSAAALIGVPGLVSMGSAGLPYLFFDDDAAVAAMSDEVNGRLEDTLAAILADVDETAPESGGWAAPASNTARCEQWYRIIPTTLFTYRFLMWSLSPPRSCMGPFGFNSIVLTCVRWVQVSLVGFVHPRVSLLI